MAQEKSWVTESKYYKIRMTSDDGLNWVIFRWWGSFVNRKGNKKISVFKTQRDAQRLLNKIAWLCGDFLILQCVY